MKWIIVLVFSVFAACSENKTDNKKPLILDQAKLSDLNLVIETDVKVDSILICNITQEREFHYIPFSDTLYINLNDSINDQYQINFFTGKDFKMSRLWLNGKNLIIKGKFTNKLEIDTVIGSDMYYRSIAFRQKYKELQESKTDSATINNFLIDELNRHIKEPFSIEIANSFYFRNSKNANELQRLYTVLRGQDETLRKHLVNPYEKIGKQLSIKKIEMAGYQFYDLAKNLSSLKFSKGKKYLLDYWFIECAPCIADHKLIAAKQKVLSSNNVEVISISIDKDHDKWKNFFTGKNYGWPQYREVNEMEKTLRKFLQIEEFPTYLLLDTEGSILFRANSFSDVEGYLKL
jgi:thiol-disulfide isomerase/thioredoxin